MLLLVVVVVRLLLLLLLVRLLLLVLVLLRRRRRRRVLLLPQLLRRRRRRPRRCHRHGGVAAGAAAHRALRQPRHWRGARGRTLAAAAAVCLEQGYAVRGGGGELRHRGKVGRLGAAVPAALHLLRSRWWWVVVVVGGWVGGWWGGAGGGGPGGVCEFRVSRALQAAVCPAGSGSRGATHASSKHSSAQPWARALTCTMATCCSSRWLNMMIWLLSLSRV